MIIHMMKIIKISWMIYPKKKVKVILIQKVKNQIKINMVDQKQ